MQKRCVGKCEAEHGVSFNTCMLGGVCGQGGSKNEQSEGTNSQRKVTENAVKRAREMAPDWPRKCEDLSLIPSTQVKAGQESTHS